MKVSEYTKEYVKEINDLILEWDDGKDDGKGEGIFNAIMRTRALALAKSLKPAFDAKLLRRKGYEFIKNSFILITSPIWILPVMVYLKVTEWLN